MESATEVVATDGTRASSKLAGFGWGLIACAFIKPIASAAAGSNPALQGERLGQMLMTTIALLIVLGVALRKRSPKAKNYGRIAIGTVLMGFAAWPLAQPGTSDAEKKFIRESQVIQARQVAATMVLTQRFNAVDMNGLLTPDALATEPGMRKARATLEAYRSLLTERKRLLDEFNTEFETFFNTRSPSDIHKQSALASFNANKALTAKMYGDLDLVQSAYAETIGQILDWGAAQSKAGRIGIKGGQILFASAMEQSELQNLVAKLQSSEKRLNEAVSSAGVLQDQAQAKLQEANRQAANMLSR